MSGAYFQENALSPEEAENHFAGWTLDELLVLRDYWRLVDLHDIAVHLGRSESACVSMYYFQRRRPPHEQFTPAEKGRGAWGGEHRERLAQDERVNGPVRADDEGAWWTADYYRSPEERRQEVPG